MSEHHYGHAVENGRVRFFSVTGLEKADPRGTGCFRAWFYRYVMGLKQADKEKNLKAKAKGDALHLELKNYLRTGVKALSSLALKGLHIVPDPGPDVLAEHPIFEIGPNGEIISALTAAGIPFVGQLDCAHDRRTNKGAEYEIGMEGDVYGTLDPVGTIELLDWKFKGNTEDRYGNSTLLRPEDLVRTIQMSGYGVWLGRKTKASYIRLSHGYFPEKGGAPRKVTKLHVIDDCARNWEYVESLARTVIDVAKETNPDRVDANRNACDAYGGCPHRDYCKLHQFNSLASIMGESAAMGLLTDLQQVASQPQPSQPQQLMPMPGAVPQQPMFDPTQGQPQQVMAAQLAAEENALRQQQAVQQQMMQQPAPQQMMQVPVTQPTAPTLNVSPGYLEAWARIESFGLGFPCLGNPVAQMHAIARGSAPPQSGYAGAGALGKLNFNSVDQVMWLANLQPQQAQQLAMEMQQQAQPQAQQQPAPQPLAQVPTQVSVLAPDAPQSIPSLAAQQPAQAQQIPTTAFQPISQPTPEAPKRGRGRPKKSDSAPAATTNVAAGVVPPPSSAPAPQAIDARGTNTAGVESDLFVYVNCIPLDGEFTRLDFYIDTLCDQLAKKFCVDMHGQPTVPDIRCAPKDSILAFGGWEGIVHAAVRAAPPADDIYVIITRYNRIAEVVADAMRCVCLARGIASNYVQGV